MASCKGNINVNIWFFQRSHVFRGAAELCFREPGAPCVACSPQTAGQPADGAAAPDSVHIYLWIFFENLIHIYLISSSFQFYQWIIITQTTWIPRRMLKIHGTQKYNAIMISCFLTQYPLSAGTLGPCNLTKIRKVEEVQFTGFICISNCTECRKRSCINSIKFAHIYFLPFWEIG